MLSNGISIVDTGELVIDPDNHNVENFLKDTQVKFTNDYCTKHYIKQHYEMIES